MKIGDRVRVWSGSGPPPGAPEEHVGTVVDGPDEVGNWKVRWDVGPPGWELLDDEDLLKEDD